MMGFWVLTMLFLWHHLKEEGRDVLLCLHEPIRGQMDSPSLPFESLNVTTLL